MPSFSLRRSSSATPFLLVSSRGQGFTLVEILAAVAVLSLLMLITAAMMNATTATTSSSNKHLNADAQARLVFDRMQMDIDGMLKRHDLDFQFTKQTGNDTLYFYSQAPGYFDGGTVISDQNNVSLVGYSINGLYQLQRLGRGLQWALVPANPALEVAFFPAVFTVNDSPTNNDANFHVLAPGVFRLEIALVVRQDDNTSIITDTPPEQPTYPPPASPGDYFANFANISAIVVDIGILDTDSRTTVQKGVTTIDASTASGYYSKLVTALPDFSGSQTLNLTTPGALGSPVVDPILNSWNTALSSPSFYQTAGIPKAVAVQVRVFERTFNLK